MLPRMIDIARAKLDGGNPAEYQIGRGLSGLVLDYLQITAAELLERVRNAASEEEVVAPLLQGRESGSRLLSRKLGGITVAHIPAELRPQFESFYGRDLPPNRLVFDILEADDAKTFGSSA